MCNKLQLKKTKQKNNKLNKQKHGVQGRLYGKIIGEHI